MTVSITRAIKIALSTSGQGQGRVDVPFLCKEIRVKAVVFDDLGVGNDGYFIVNSGIMPNTPIGLVYGVNARDLAVASEIRYLIQSPRDYAGQIDFWLTDLLGVNVTLAGVSALCVIMEFIRADE